MESAWLTSYSLYLNIFSLVLTVETLKAYNGRSRLFSRGGWVTLSANFRWKGTSPSDIFWYKKTRLITLSYGIKISAVCFIDLSQSTRVTDEQTYRQNYDLQVRASIAASCCKNRSRLMRVIVEIKVTRF